MNINSLFEHLNDRSGWKEINLRETTKDSWEAFALMIEDAFPQVTSALLDLKKEIIDPLTAGKIREIYRQVIAEKQTGIHNTATIAEMNDRLLYDTVSKTYKVSNTISSRFSKSKRRENAQTRQKFYHELVSNWGKQRVSRVAKEYCPGFTPEFVHKTKPLYVRHVREMMMGLADFDEADLISCFEKIKKICEGKAKVDTLPKRSLYKLQSALGKENFQQKLRNHFEGHLDKPILKLPLEQFKTLQKAVFLNQEELELTFHGKRLEGAITGHCLPIIRKFFYSKTYELQQRLQLYQKLMVMGPKTHINQSFHELLVKGIVKKDHMHKGIYIPTPATFEGGSEINWYRIDRKIMTGRSKVAYHLTQANNHASLMPDILMYRSSATCPSALDSFTSWVTDSYPIAPPGYFWKKLGIKKEEIVLNTNTDRPLRIMGHSLGGSYAQLAIINHMAKTLPARKLEVITFDSPAIKKTDANAFSTWVNNNSIKAKNISIHHWFSQGTATKFSFPHYFFNGDITPGGGEIHLGHGIDPSKLKGAGCTILKKKNPGVPSLNLPAHGSLYFSADSRNDFEKKTTTIEEYNAQEWRKTSEMLRKFLGAIFFVFFFIFGYLSRLIFGWRGQKKPKPVPISDLLTSIARA